MEKETIESLLEMLSDGNGFGDPDARRNAEVRLQVLQAREQAKIASRLNFLTALLVIVGLLNAAIFAIQVAHGK